MALWGTVKGPCASRNRNICSLMQFLVENNEHVYLLLSSQKGVSSSLLLQGCKNQSWGNHSFPIPYLFEFCCFSPSASAHKIPRLIPHSEQFGKPTPAPCRSSLVSSLMTLQPWVWPALLGAGSGQAWSIHRSPVVLEKPFLHFFRGLLGVWGWVPLSLALSAVRASGRRLLGSNLSVFFTEAMENPGA